MAGPGETVIAPAHNAYSPGSPVRGILRLRAAIAPSPDAGGTFVHREAL